MMALVSRTKMSGPVDPTYPLLPTAYILASLMLLLVFLSSFIRQSWNLGVAFLCFWLLCENITTAADTIIWSDNADVRLEVYCDIGRRRELEHRQPVALTVVRSGSHSYSDDHLHRQTHGDPYLDAPTALHRKPAIG